MRPDPVKDAADAAKLTLTKSEEERAAQARPYRPKVLHTNPAGKDHPWWYTYACARIGRILEGAKPSLGAFSRDAALESACASAAYPKLARRYIETYAYFVTRSKPPPLIGTDHNPFRGLSDRDAYAKWYTLIENICEASTDKMRGWRVGLSETGAARNR